MTDDPRTQPLLEWNRLARENTENAVVSSMFEGTLKASEPIETFTTWLLIGAATVASFFVSNADKLIPVITKTGFIACGVFLLISCIFGFMSKFFALRCKVGSDTSIAVMKTFQSHLLRHQEEEEKIQEGAKFWGIGLQTGICMDRVLEQYLAPFPWWVKWTAMRHLKKYSGNPQIAYLSHIKNLNAQGIYTFMQALCFLGFLGSGFFFATTS